LLASGTFPGKEDAIPPEGDRPLVGGGFEGQQIHGEDFTPGDAIPHSLAHYKTAMAAPAQVAARRWKKSAKKGVSRLDLCTNSLHSGQASHSPPTMTGGIQRLRNNALFLLDFKEKLLFWAE
jgi:hypothetical protein